MLHFSFGSVLVFQTVGQDLIIVVSSFQKLFFN